MVPPVHGKDPGKSAPRTYKTVEPAGEIAVVHGPEGVLKVVVSTGSGEKQQEHTAITMDRQAAFDFAMELLQHAYRLGEGL